RRMTEGGEEPYKIDYVNRGELFARLTNRATEAARLGLREQFTTSLKVIEEKLRTQPLEWGDPQFRARHAKSVMCHGMHLLLHVYYAVHEESRVVWVKEIKPLPGHGFTESP